MHLARVWFSARVWSRVWARVLAGKGVAEIPAGAGVGDTGGGVRGSNDTARLCRRRRRSSWARSECGSLVE